MKPIEPFDDLPDEVKFLIDKLVKQEMKGAPNTHPHVLPDETGSPNIPQIMDAFPFHPSEKDLTIMDYFTEGQRPLCWLWN